jgi:hypothetical protein
LRAKWFCGFEFAWAGIATPRSFSVHAVIADSVTAAKHVAARHAFISIDAPTAVTSRARKAGSIIPTGNGNTAGVGCKRA